MKFTYDGADLSKIIECFYCEGDHFYVKYLDGNVIEYFSDKNNEEELLLNLMLEQALDRKGKMSTLVFSINKILLEMIIGLSLVVCGTSIAKSEEIISIISLLFGIIGIKDISAKKRMLEELKKYDLYIDMLEDLKKIKVELEIDEVNTLNINTLDLYSYDVIKLVRKSIKKFKKELQQK